MQITPLSQAIANMSCHDGIWHGTVTEDWLQGRAGFGGYVAGLSVHAMRQQVDSARHLRSLQVAFVGPAKLGQLHIQVRVLRSGKSITFVQAEVRQGDEVTTTLTACFGVHRDSKLNVTAELLAEHEHHARIIPPENCEAFPCIPGVTPNFLRHYDMALAYGNFPFSGAPAAEFGYWLRCAQSQTMTEPDFIAACDTPPPVVLPMFKDFAPISTVTWSIDFLVERQRLEQIDVADWMFYQGKATNAEQGFSQQRIVFYSPEGQPLAINTQTVAIFY